MSATEDGGVAATFHSACDEMEKKMMSAKDEDVQSIKKTVGGETSNGRRMNVKLRRTELWGMGDSGGSWQYLNVWSRLVAGTSTLATRYGVGAVNGKR